MKINWNFFLCRGLHLSVFYYFYFIYLFIGFAVRVNMFYRRIVSPPAATN